MKSNLLFLILKGFFNTALSQKPLLVGDCTVTYVISGSDLSIKKNLSGSTKIFYVKAKMARTDFIAEGYRQTIIYDNKTGKTVILSEIGAEKYVSNLSPEEWKEQNKKYDNKEVVFTNEKKTILGYECKKAIVKLTDGTIFSFFYALTIVPSATENPLQFKDIPGLVLEYETSSGSSNATITYTASSVNLSPVPASRFEIPTKGFRMLKQ